MMPYQTLNFCIALQGSTTPHMTTAGRQACARPGTQACACSPWCLDAATKEAFLRMQFAAQDSYYHATSRARATT